MQRLLKYRPALLATLVIVGCAVAAFAPALFQGKILAPLDITTTLLPPWKDSAHGAKPHNHSPSDAVTQYLPYRIHAEESLREDGYIGWNPYEMGGYSLAANTMALPASWTMQLHRFLPFEQAWDFGILAEFLIAGIGMLVFLRSRSLPWLACVLGALAYMGNSQFIIWIYHRWALSSFSWMPWVLWAAPHGLSWKNPGLRQLLLPCFLALALLGGSLQHMAFVGLACGCLVAGGIPNLKSAPKQWPVVAAWGLAFCLAFGMAAFTIEPQILAYFTNIAVGNTRGGIGYPMGPTQPFFNLLAIPAQVWPWLLGDPQSIDSWRLLKADFMNLAYLGTVPMVLALAGLFHKSMPRQAKWLILAGLLIPLTPLVGPLYHRVQLLFLLGGSWMAAEMLAHICVAPPRRLIRGMALTVIALGAALLVGTCLPSKIRTSVEDQVVAKSLVATAASSFRSDPAWIERRARGWTARFSLTHPRTAWVYGLLIAGTAGLLLSSRPGTAGVKWGNLVILSVTALELFTLFQTWTTFSDPRDLRPGHPLIEKIRLLAGPNRVLQRTPGVAFADMFATPNLLASYAIPSVDSYESIQYRSSSVVLADAAPDTRLSLAGVGVSVQPAGTPAQNGTAAWPVIETSGGYSIRKNPRVPAPLVAGRGQIPGNPQATVVALETATPISPTVQTMNRWAFDAPQDSTWIRISQNWHDGWRWRVPGGDWQPFRKGADAACWIDLAPNQPHPLEARFFPRATWLTWVSLATVVAWLGLIPTACYINRRRCH